MDTIAQELNKTFTLVISTDQFGGADVTIRDRLEVIIIDSNGRLTVHSSHYNNVDIFFL